MDRDPVATNPDLYRVILDNEQARVLEYRDRPGDRTTPHSHPDSVMVTLGAFRRRLIHGDRSTDVELTEGMVQWLPAQEHSGENIGDTETHVIFVELKGAGGTGRPNDAALGPQPS